MNAEQFGALFLMVYTATHLFKGWRLARIIGFCALWQAFSPVRPWYIDLPFLAASILLIEVVFKRRMPDAVKGE